MVLCYLQSYLQYMSTILAPWLYKTPMPWHSQGAKIVDMYIANRSGDSTEPCLSPKVTVFINADDIRLYSWPHLLQS